MTLVSEDPTYLSDRVEFRFSAVVERGSGRGRRLGFPTANLGVAPEQAAALPRGVYVARVQWARGREYGAVLNIGVRPTFSERQLVVEAHVLDFSGDLYGEILEVSVLQRLREERRFADVESLICQVEQDIEMARAALGRAARQYPSTN